MVSGMRVRSGVQHTRVYGVGHAEEAPLLPCRIIQSASPFTALNNSGAFLSEGRKNPFARVHGVTHAREGCCI